ncbi:MAG: phosphotransferase [Oscillospiraceae bacterium]|nr:phosphotransferase [Oscillospiraceae bacterium]
MTMEQTTYHTEEGTLVFLLPQRVDSASAPDVENAIDKARTMFPDFPVVLDCSRLEYISSSGLRVILRLKKAAADTSLIEVSPEVYDILEMTGFTEMMDVRKAFRTFSTEGCEIIGQGSNGIIYRIDQETIVKAYRNPEALDEIRNEQQLARTAFILGIPTAIPYDVVRIASGGYGSVFELLDAAPLSSLLLEGKLTVEEAAERSIALLKTIHSTTVRPGSVPDMRLTALNWAAFLREYLEPDLSDKLERLLTGMPEDLHMLHGDYHIRNILMQNDELLLIDMDTICHGHPVFELASMYNDYIGYGELDPSVSPAFFGISQETATEFWNRSLHLYCGDLDASTIRSISEKAQVIGYMRIMRRSIRRIGFADETGRALIENCHRHLRELLPKIDSLLF